MLALRWLDPPRGPAIELLDQTRLPAAEAFLICYRRPQLVDAIGRLVVRGAPLLGVAGAFGVALAAARGDDVEAAAADHRRRRPTAVNLGWGVAAGAGGLSERAAAGRRPPFPVRILARKRPWPLPGPIAADDAAASAAMARHGLGLVPAGARILTHCNTGAWSRRARARRSRSSWPRTGRAGWPSCGSTRPGRYLQGARLTAWEARRAGIPHALLADSAAASLMAAGAVDLVLTGRRPDRRRRQRGQQGRHLRPGGAGQAPQVPFVVVAPVSTVDLDTPDGASIIVEHRSADEVASVAGQRGRAGRHGGL